MLGVWQHSKNEWSLRTARNSARQQVFGLATITSTTVAAGRELMPTRLGVVVLGEEDTTLTRQIPPGLPHDPDWSSFRLFPRGGTQEQIALHRRERLLRFSPRLTSGEMAHCF